MEDFEEILERFKDMLFGFFECEIFFYWIWGEYEEVRIYWGFVKKVEEFRFLFGFFFVFRKLVKEFEEYGDILKRIYVKIYGEELKKVDLLYIEVEVFLKVFEDLENIFKVFVIVMEIEFVVMELYRYFVLIMENEEVRKVY